MLFSALQSFLKWNTKYMDMPRSGHFLLRAPHGTVYRLPHKTDLHKTPACKSKECEDCSDISCPDFSSRQECPPKCRKGCKNQLSRSKPESVVRECRCGELKCTKSLNMLPPQPKKRRVQNRSGASEKKKAKKS
ncbi:hypothetical protein B9Z55_011044 [Caenorhabditis nigoni]|uniref:Uncharacterized protein n=1 Tax=Caenorhabditis nigoni TaxID=1611254 RepID=A0A2G5UID6_9PELO|nr:hypothetical protein B9Z55_011044 [Caenorhabditis nigoni]